MATMHDLRIMSTLYKGNECESALISDCLSNLGQRHTCIIELPLSLLTIYSKIT